MKKKYILFLGKCDDIFERTKEMLIHELSSAQICPVFVLAKDGADAALRIQNQMFDVIVIDTQMPRLLEGGFVHGLSSMKNTVNANLIVINHDPENLPKPLEIASQFLARPYESDLLFTTLLKAVLGDQKLSPTKQNHFAVDVRVLNALIKATLFIVQQFGLKDVKMMKPESKSPEAPWLGDVASYMEIQSQMFQGALVVSFEKSIYLKILTNMLGEEQTEITADNADAIGEINNMILGNAKPEFTQYKIEMSLPKIMKKGDLPPTPAKSVVMLIPFELPEGRIHIEVVAHPLSAKAVA